MIITIGNNLYITILCYSIISHFMSSFWWQIQKPNEKLYTHYHQ